ncbi:MAG: transposase [Verrucomicrobiales bacterium]|nr:transposase [Verrucomicrobiales bacterium]
MSSKEQVRFNPYNPCGETSVSNRNLPHWEQPQGCYFITYRLVDSIPQNLILELRIERDDWLKKHPKPWDESTRREFGRLFTKREQDWLDAGYGGCHLRLPKVRTLIVSCLEKFDEVRYDVDCYTLMPNHVHLIWQMRDEYTNKRELQSLKGVSARKCNKYFNQTGSFWMDESYDRLIRDKEELNAFRKYIESNPSKAGLSEDHYSLQLNHRLTCY